MIKYGKIKEDGSIEFAPRNKDGISNWTSDTEAVLAEGYLPVETPLTPAGMAFKRYIEKDGVITMEFEENYLAQRRYAYPSTEEQLDMMYWDKVYGTTIWEDTVRAIKEKYPKPEEVVAD